MRYFTLQLKIAEDALGETITAVTPLVVAQRVVIDTVAPFIEPVVSATHRKRDSKGDAAASTTRLGKLALETLRTGYCTTQEVGEVLAGQGFAAVSASPILSKLIKENLVERTRTLLNGTQTTVYRLRPAASA